MAAAETQFRHYQCWRRDRVRSVINLDAERSERNTFLAVHTDRPIRVASALAGFDEPGRFAEWTTERFRQEFLAETDRNISAVILGDSGSGKSHLIKWLSVHVEETPSRIVLTIPKAGTSLRGIIQMLLSRLPEDVAAPYRAALDAQTFEDATPRDRRKTLAAFIAVELRRLVPAEGDRRQAWLVPDRLPLLFQDVQTVNHHLVRDGGLLDRLVDHVGERTGAGALDTPLEFSVEDLPRAGADIGRAAAETQKVLKLLTGDDEMEETAVGLVNQVLAKAIARAVAFPPEKLFEVMLDLRRHLAREGRELVLLIEDFARLEGIDGGLLQALIEDGGTGTDLCVLRWCMAVTSGPFVSKVRTTLKTRLTLEVDMDQSAAELSHNSDDLALFAAHYLNAMRLSDKSVSGWVDSGALPPVPSACDGCVFRGPCHEAFGEINGIGLYPFTRVALHQLEKLTNPAATFNPRRFIKGVLKPTFSDHDLDWSSGVFPSGSFHRDVGGPSQKITAPARLRIRETYSPEEDRYTALLDLWGDKDLEVEPRVAQAFGMRVSGPPPEGLRKDDGIGYDKDDGIGDELSAADRRLIDALNAWGAGGDLVGDVVNSLRKLVYDAVEAHIDWDDVGMAPGYFLRAEPRSYFRPAHISFQNQLMNTTPGEMRLVIPSAAADDCLRASIALQALVILAAGGQFRRGDGPRALIELSLHLEAWSAEVVGQVRGLAARLGPLEDACDVLVHRTALAGRTPSSRVGWVDGAFLDSDEITAPSAQWQDVYDSLREERTHARDLVRALSSASKGGQARAVIDPRPLLDALARMERGDMPIPEPPGSRSALSDSARSARRIFPSLLRTEAARQQGWRAAYAEHLGDADSFAVLKAAIDDLQRELIRCGVPFSRAKSDAVNQAIAVINPKTIDETARAVAEWESGDAGLSDIARPEHWAAIRNWETALPAIESFLDEVDRSISGVTGVEALADAIRDAQARIDPLFEELIEAASELEARQ